MKYSKHNIFSKVKDSDKYYIVNLLSGHADLVEPDEAFRLNRIKSSSEETDCAQDLCDKGYLTDAEKENRTFRNKYLDFIDNRDQDEVQLFFILNYTCNFNCDYCYQDQYTNPVNQAGTEIIDAFFSYIQRKFSDRKKYITVFGGEPLLSSPVQKKKITYLLEKANEAKLDVCFVTNGYTLEDYIEILKTCRIREIQVTIDGTENIHNKRRPLKGGGKTFERIVRGVDTCLENNMPINLRMVIDKENIENLPDFAQFAIDKGWTSNPLFKTQIGRNYELHHCQSTPDKLFSRISLYRKIFESDKGVPAYP